MGRRIGCLDIGSHSAQCLIVEETSSNRFSVLFDQALVSGLGVNLSPSGLDPRAISRTFGVLEQFRATMKELRVSEIRAAATAAARDAVDGQLFVRRIDSEFGIPTIVVSAQQEAGLNFLATSKALTRDHPIAMLDIGGRSTEIAVGTLDSPDTWSSLPIGSVSGTEKYLRGDPVSEESILILRKTLYALFRDVPPPPPNTEMVAISATATTFAAMELQMTEYSRGRVHGMTLTRNAIGLLVSRLAEKPLARRAECPGLAPGRAEVILAGGVILKHAMEWSMLPQITVCDYGLRHGLLYDTYPDARIEYPEEPPYRDNDAA